MKFPHYNLSVRTHLFILVLSIFLPATGVFTWHVAREFQAAREEAYGRVKELANETAANLRKILDNNEAVLGRLAARPLVRALDAKHCDPIFRDYISLHPEFGTLALRDSRANLICTLLTNTPAAEDIRRTGWFQEAMRSGEFTLGNAARSSQLNRWVSISAFPVHDDRKNISGFIFTSLDLLKLNSQIFRSIPKNAVISIIDRQGKFLLRSLDPEKWIGQSIPEENAARIRSLREGYFTRIGVDGGLPRLYAFVTVPGTGWRVFAGMPEEAVLAASRARLAGSITVGITVLILALVLAYWIALKIVYPISRLANTASNISRGDIRARAHVAGPQEVAAVALQFNTMLDMQERAATDLRLSGERPRAREHVPHLFSRSRNAGSRGFGTDPGHHTRSWGGKTCALCR